MSAARKWLWIAVETIGGLSILCVVFMLGAAAWCAWGMARYSEKTNALKPRDAREILRWGGIEQKAEVQRFLYSKVSSTSFTGDHDDFFVLEMKRFPKAAALQSGKWLAGPLADPTLQKTVDFSMSWGAESYPDFPARTEVARHNYLFSFPWINLSGQRVTAAIVMFYDPASKRLFVIDSKT
jgi:hypothetical protein